MRNHHYDPERHRRRSIRLKGYDYSRCGAYFITVVVRRREHLFGEIIHGVMYLNDFGRMVQKTWDGLPDHYPHIRLDTFVIMPDHIHGIIVIGDAVGAGLKPAPTDPINPTAPTDQTSSAARRHGLSEIVRAFKTFSARAINGARKTTGIPLWQRNYYEHIIRNELSLRRIRRYIIRNPEIWHGRHDPPKDGPIS